MRIKIILVSTVLCVVLFFTAIEQNQGNIEYTRPNQWEKNLFAKEIDTGKDWLEDIELPKNIYSNAFVLMDGSSNRVLYGKDIDSPFPMASTTKIMTCILAIEYGDMEDYVEISSYAAAMPDVQLGVKVGESYRLKDLLYSMMLESHNDVAVAIAEHIGGDVEAFAKLMNQKARDLGCSNTYFITPNGLDAIDKDNNTHSTSARDLGIIMNYCIKNKLFCEITATKSYSFTDKEGKRQYRVNNKNALFDMIDGVISGKTGYTGRAGYCYVCAVNRDDRSFIIALLGAGWPPNKNYKWSDVKKLVSFGAKYYKNIELYKPQDIVEKILVENGYTSSAMSYSTQKVCGLVRGNEQIRYIYKVPLILEAPLKYKEIVGTIDIYIDNQLFTTVPVKAKESVKEIDYKYMLRTVWGEYICK